MVSAAGFGDRRRSGVTEARPGQTAVAAGTFDVAAPTTAPPAAPRPAPALRTAVEIIFKPTPAYTEEARSKGIQGDVVLSVEFTAAGTVRVLRVVRGLGYGLDEMATRAAERIRFKPATEDGRPVDVRADVQIVFRLT